MTFVYPQFLWALSALAIPLLIHLFNFQRPKVLVFSSIRNLKEIKQQTRNLRQLKRYLVLVTRMIAITALVFAFAQPIWKSTSGLEKSGQPLVLVYIDNSYSMQARASQGSLLDLAIATAERAVNQYPSQTRFCLLTNDFSSSGGGFVTKKEFLNQIRTLSYSNNYRSASTVVNRIERQFDNQASSNRQCLLFSDFQKATLGEVTALATDSLKDYRIIPLLVEPQPNVFVDSVYLENPLVIKGEQNLIHIQLKNAGAEDARNTPLRVFVGNVQVSAQQVSVSRNSSLKTEVTLQLSSDSATACRIELDDQPNTFDNTYYFTLSPSKPIAVYAISRKKSSYLTQVFNNPKLFRFKENTENDIDYEALKQSSFVILNDLQAVSPAVLSTLQQNKSRKSVLVLPGRDASPVSFKTLYDFFGVAKPTSMSADTTQANNAIQYPSPTDTYFKGVFEAAKERTVNTTLPAHWQLAGRPILKYKSGISAVVESKTTKGLIYTAAGSPYDNTSSLAKSALFLPMLYKMAFSSLSNIEQLSYSFQNTNMMLAVEDSSASETPFQLKKGTFSVIPQQNYRNGNLLMALPHSQASAGVYSLEKNGKSYGTIALNYANTESYLDNYTSKELADKLGNYKHIKVNPPLQEARAGADIFVQQQGTPLWKYCLAIVLAALIAEIAFIRLLK